MNPKKTFELRLLPVKTGEHPATKTKNELMDWLIAHGVNSFVEGSLDVDVNHDYETTEDQYFEQFGGQDAPISVYKFSLDEIEGLKAQIVQHYGARIDASVHSMDTDVWQEGWKESFKPFATKKFYVRPPWERAQEDSTLMDLVIEPGMAFGTGQHATTKLCIQTLEQMDFGTGRSLLDVGTGTGILAIAAVKLGLSKAVGTDIEVDAVNASRDNAVANNVTIDFEKGSVPAGQTYDFVFANILTVVLRKILPDIAEATNSGGTVLLSGILNEEDEEMIGIAKGCGLTLKAPAQLSGWSCLTFSKE
jgi:ribosomal protein L11 methyltransferase